MATNLMSEAVSQDNVDGPSGSVRLADRIAPLASASQPFTIWTAAKIAVLVAIIVWMDRRQFPMMFKTWLTDPNWSHGFLIPLFSVYLIYTRWGEIMAAPRKASIVGLVAVIITGFLHIVPYMVQNPWSGQITMVLLATALVLYLAGWHVLKYLWLPILFLIFAMPISQSIYNSTALTLQNVAATWSARALQLFAVPVDHSGSTLWVTTMAGNVVPLRVEEACSGVRLLMAFVALSVAMAYMADRPIWQRVTLVLMGIPVAIACNVLRVVITCMMFIIGKEQFGKDFMHTFTGMVMLIPAVAILWLAGLIMQKLFIEEEIEDDQEDAGAQPAQAGGQQ